MDYEKKYKDALERFRAFKEKYYTKNTVIGDAIFDKTGEMQRDFESIFPELRESEDERIRKYLIDELKVAKSVGELKFTIPQPTREECIAYLEKQKEQKPEDKEITLTNFEEVLNTFLFDFANSPIEDCEPKEYTKKHSAEILKAAYAELNAQLKQDIFEAQQEGRREGYEAAKAEQKPAEWSEEDEDMLNSCISSIEEAKENRYAYKETDGDTSYDHEIAWLKSIRPSWKPSEEQMNCLCAAVDAAIRKHNESVSGYKPARVLKSLYEQLRKL